MATMLMSSMLFELTEELAFEAGWIRSPTSPHATISELSIWASRCPPGRASCLGMAFLSTLRRERKRQENLCVQLDSKSRSMM